MKIFGNGNSGYLLKNCLTMVVVAIVLVVAAFIFVGFYTHHGESIEVPNLRGMTISKAIDELDELGLKAEVVDTGFVRSLPPGVVLEQSMAAGKHVKSGRTVQLTVNAASARKVALPDLADNCSLREAEAKLSAIGFTVGPPEYTIGDRDWVYGVKVHGRTVAAGTRISTDDVITLVVGDGMATQEFNGNDSLDYEIFGHEIDSVVEEVVKQVETTPQKNKSDELFE